MQCCSGGRLPFIVASYYTHNSRCFYLQGTQLSASDDTAETTKITEELGATSSTEAQGITESLLVGVDALSLSEDYLTLPKSVRCII
jgi:hypothetical protein